MKDSNDVEIVLHTYCNDCGSKMRPSKPRKNLATGEVLPTLECAMCRKWVFE